MNVATTNSVPQKAETLAHAAERHALALAHTGIITWVWDTQTDEVDCDQGFFALFGLPPTESVTAQHVMQNIHADDLPRVTEALENCFDNKTSIYDCRFRVPRAEGEWRWLQGKGQVTERDETGAPLKIVGINFDLTEQVKWEERVQMIASEMKHRVKNSLAMVNALAAATAREADNIQHFLQQFRGRVDAIAAAQQIATDAGGTVEMTMRAAVEGGMAPFSSSTEWRMRVQDDGLDETLISGSVSQAVTLLIYELATNAVKYGALSDKGGTITVKSEAPSENYGTCLVWHEALDTKDPIVLGEEGFGSVLVSRLVQGERGTIERKLEGNTITVRVEFPL